MSRKLDDLDPRLKPLAIELLARCIEANIPVMIIDTLRTPEEHAANLKKGTSWIKFSKHLPQPEHSDWCAYIRRKKTWPSEIAVVNETVCDCGFGKAGAIDICPWSIFQFDGPDKLLWDADSPVWDKIGAIGEKLGLRWGGRWQKRDMGHFEFVQ